MISEECRIRPFGGIFCIDIRGQECPAQKHGCGMLGNGYGACCT